MKAEFSALLLQSSVSYKKHFWLLSTVVLPNAVYFSRCSDEWKDKKQHLFEIEIFCNIMNVFTVTLDLFNAALLNKSIQIFSKLCNSENKVKYLDLIRDISFDFRNTDYSKNWINQVQVLPEKHSFYHYHDHLLLEMQPVSWQIDKKAPLG